MGKSKTKSYKLESSRYMDGYNLPAKKKTNLEKSKEKRFKRAIKIHNVDDLLDLEDNS